MTKSKIFLSFDIEADGPTPMLNNMTSIGIYAFDENNNHVDSYQRNIKNVEGHITDPATQVEFLDTHPDLVKFLQTDQVTPYECMAELATFLSGLSNKKIVWLARPGAFDWQWLNGYYHTFGPEDKPKLGFKADCISSMWKACVRCHKIDSEKESKLWKMFTTGEAMTHNPLDDARYQAKLYQGLCTLMDNGPSYFFPTESEENQEPSISTREP